MGDWGEIKLEQIDSHDFWCMHIKMGTYMD